MDEDELMIILEKHQHWLREDCDGWESMKADLRNADLRGADLRGADICFANLDGANLDSADLRYANLRNADLRGVCLSYADLSYADLRNTNLIGAILNGTILDGADLSGTINIPFIPYSCPDFGGFIGYKKAKDGIVELEIPADAKRCSATGRKCRCNKAKVLGIYDCNHKLLDIKETVSNYDNTFVYKVGEMVEEPNFDENRWNECTKGIHFFVNFQEAVNY